VTEISEKKQAIIDAYLEALAKNGFVTMNDLIDSGFTKDMVTHHFRSLKKLTKIVRLHHPDAFFDEYIDKHIGFENVKCLDEIVASNKRFIVTTAVTGRRVDESLLQAMVSYCEHNDAKILVLVASDPSTHTHAPDAKYGTIDSKIINCPHAYLVVGDLQLNLNICLSTLKVAAKQIDPSTGMARHASNEGTFVFASPKQRLKAVPAGAGKLPYFTMTTGAVTVPDYSRDSYMSNRTAFMAERDHVMGGLIIEIQDDEIYFFRQFQCRDEYSFVDMGIRYSKEGVEDERPEAFVLGDWHSGSTDPQASSVWEEVCKNLKPHRLVLHDTFDGRSINHHERANVIVRAIRANNSHHDLESEVEGLVKDLNMLSTWVDKLVVVKSNHDEFLEEYLGKGYYVKDPQNHLYSLSLAEAMILGKDPLKYAVEQKGFTSWDKVDWLERDEDYRVAGVQLGVHGDKGPNGSRGSVKSMEVSYGQSITGHSHTPEIVRGAWQTGTSTYLKLGYNKGASSWLQSSCLLYKDGSRQLINVINGKYKLHD
jgi:hypothetical protein